MNSNDDLPPPMQDPSVEPGVVASAAVSAAPAQSAKIEDPRLSGFEPLLAEFAKEYLRDRRSERRWKLFMRLFWLALLVFFGWAVFSQQHHHTASTSSPHTALVELQGEIAADTEASAEQLLSGLRAAFEDQGSQAVVLRINSPGGSPVQAGIVYDEIKRLKAKHGKKLYVVVDEMCASGAYYIAAGADEIFVDKASVVGSIGVLMDGFGFTGLMNKLGVERRLMTAGENKGMLDPFKVVSPKQQAFAQAMLDQIHQQFIAVVREGRGDRLKETPEMFSGLFWNGEQAVKLGLADHFGTLDFVAREVVKAEEVVDYTPHDNVAERLAKRFGASLGEAAVKSVQRWPGLR
ncbi:S49 family peptidase [Roseateles koreensis]|uniref:S49 family peptidase n=1 Tax=Roseateles koreensis TaxID=2987526 RepID=A0ABT5KMK7_9BURK|nr:S49 family peptidase [Roseateles koreensis]MDC8784062.1 S49 family peptidase [Roseateles koreensis]